MSDEERTIRKSIYWRIVKTTKSGDMLFGMDISNKCGNNKERINFIYLELMKSPYFLPVFNDFYIATRL